MITSIKSKKIAAIVVFALTVTTCAIPANGQGTKIEYASNPTNPIVAYESGPMVGYSIVDFIVNRKTELTMLEEQAEAEKAHRLAVARKTRELSLNTLDLKNAVNLASNQIDKTWYVFSGSTPSGWDCSGLVLWMYAHLDIELYHSATVQMMSGDLVSTPKFGDIVGFSWNGSSRYYHVGIYISEDLMLHSGGKKGDVTELRLISSFGGDSSTVRYSRIIETN